MREYGREVMALVEIAHTKTNRAMVATVMAKKNWERTLEWLQRLFQVRELAERVAGKLRTAVSRFIYQQIWRGVKVERWADTAAEVGRHKAKYFAWLCKHHGVGQATPDV
jgi:hypothetical protein